MRAVGNKSSAFSSQVPQISPFTNLRFAQRKRLQREWIYYCFSRADQVLPIIKVPMETSLSLSPG